MSKKLVLLLVGIVVFSMNLSRASASVLINEVEISPTESRFIELYNTSDSEIKLTGYYLQRKTATGSSFSSLVSSTNFENKKISGKGYFLISRNSISGSDLVVSNMTLTESNTIQIKNPDGEVLDKICWGAVSECGTLTVENPEEGKSIQRQNNSLSIGTPSPRGSNQDTTDTETDVTIKENDDTQATTLVTNNKKPVLKIINKNSGFVGIPMEFEAKIDNLLEPNMYGKYIWNFGDGTGAEFYDYQNKKFAHTFYYAGDYLVNIEYYTYSQQLVPDYTAKINIKIIHPNVFISDVGDGGNFFVEITNTSVSDIDISHWFLVGNNKVFTFPRNTNLLSMKKIILSPRITNFNLEDLSFLELLDENGTLIFSYKNLLNKNKTQTQSQTTLKKVVEIKNNTETSSKKTENISINSIGQEFFQEEHVREYANQEVLGTAILRDQDNTGIKNNLMPVFLFGGLVVVAVGVVYFLRKNRGTKDELDDFEIVDE